MDAKITARFFRVSAKPDGSADFPDILLEAIQVQPAGKREHTFDQATIRLERCDTAGDFVFGEFCRKQTKNIPPGAGEKGLAPIKLEDGQGLGHLAAFRYHRPTRTLLLQFNMQCASPGRISGYIQMVKPGVLYTLDPVLRQDAWDRFKRRQPRSLEVTFASPANLEALDDKNIPVALAAKSLAEVYKGLSVTIIVGAGRSPKKYIDAKVVEKTVNDLIQNGADMDALKVETTKEENEKAIDFLEEHLKVSAELELPDGDPVKHYEVRSAFLTAKFAANLEFLQKHFGPKK